MLKILSSLAVTPWSGFGYATFTLKNYAQNLSPKCRKALGVRSNSESAI